MAIRQIDLTLVKRRGIEPRFRGSEPRVLAVRRALLELVRPARLSNYMQIEIEPFPLVA